MKIIFILAFFLNPRIYAEDMAEKYSIEPYSKIAFKQIKEGSALLKSKNYDDVFWTLNDSDNPPDIFAIKANGELIKPSWVKEYNGLRILDALNIDWEAITNDDEGNLIIGDIGNNYNYRKDLALYKVAEPNPYYANEAAIIAKYPIKYPDQKEFPPKEDERNFDGEAMYYLNGYLYIISKNRGTPQAKVYRFKYSDLKPWSINIPEIYEKFDFKSMVTDAALSRDKKYLAVLTYNYLWLFEKPEGSDNFFKGKYWRKDIELGQCEGIAFDNNDLIISNEKRDMFKIGLKDIMK
jgi:hypothetical protein